MRKNVALEFQFGKIMSSLKRFSTNVANSAGLRDSINFRAKAAPCEKARGEKINPSFFACIHSCVYLRIGVAIGEIEVGGETGARNPATD